MHSGIQKCGAASLSDGTPRFPRDVSPSSSESSWTYVEPWWWKWYIASKRRKPATQQRSVTSHMTTMLDYISVNISTAALSFATCVLPQFQNKNAASDIKPAFLRLPRRQRTLTLRDKMLVVAFCFNYLILLDSPLFKTIQGEENWVKDGSSRSTFPGVLKTATLRSSYIRVSIEK